MAEFQFEVLESPISEAAPCGPDLELEGDATYLNFVTRMEVLLPTSYFDFDRDSIDFDAETAACSQISKKSFDLRVLVPLAKLLILNRDVRGFGKCVEGIARLLESSWETLHPQPMDGDNSYRGSILQALDDLPQTVYPLQHAPLFKTRRFGPVTYRHYLLVEKIIPPNKVITYSDEDGSSSVDEEKVPQAADLRGALGDVDLGELVGIRDAAENISAALDQIERIFDEKSGKVGHLRFKDLKALAQGLFRFLDSGVASRDPTQAKAAAAVARDQPDTDDDGADDGTPRPAVQDGIETAADALAAINAAARYFALNETTNPARLWIAQARALVGKSFYDALRALVPDYAGQATVSLTRELPLTLSIERLSDLLAEEPVEEETQADEEAVSGDWSASQDREDDEGAAGEDGTETAGDDREGAPDDTSSDEAVSEEAAPAAPMVRRPKSFVARDRNAAIRLLEVAGAYIRIAEPASPLPLLLEQAKASSTRDFVSLLRDVLPQSALRID